MCSNLGTFDDVLFLILLLLYLTRCLLTPESFYSINLPFCVCVAYSISSVAYYPARVGNVRSEHIYGGGLPLPSPTSSLYLGPGRI